MFCRLPIDSLTFNETSNFRKTFSSKLLVPRDRQDCYFKISNGPALVGGERGADLELQVRTRIFAQSGGSSHTMKTNEPPKSLILALVTILVELVHTSETKIVTKNSKLFVVCLVPLPCRMLQHFLKKFTCSVPDIWYGACELFQKVL